MPTIKQIMIQKGSNSDSRGFSTNADNVVYNDEITELNASNVQQALEALCIKVNDKNIDGNTKMDKENPTGSGSLSINRKENTTIGSNSAAVGKENEASGNNSFAEGYHTIASGDNSHTAGTGTEASGVNAIAVGNGTNASGMNSIAVGVSTEVTGSQSFAGGSRTKVHGDNSFAFGEDNIIYNDKDNSSAIGKGLQPTIENETVVGTYNNEKASYASKPVFVVGIGDEDNHKDGFAITKDGTAIVSNDVKIKTGNKIISLKDINTKIVEGFYKELTQREYDQLTEAEKNNGTVYYIKDSDPFDVAWDKVKLSRFGADDSSIKFGVDADGNFGYLKPGADTVIPFNATRKGSSLLKMYGAKTAVFWGNLLTIKEIKDV